MGQIFFHTRCNKLTPSGTECHRFLPNNAKYHRLAPSCTGATNSYKVIPIAPRSISILGVTSIVTCVSQFLCRYLTLNSGLKYEYKNVQIWFLETQKNVSAEFSVFFSQRNVFECVYISSTS